MSAASSVPSKDDEDIDDRDYFDAREDAQLNNNHD